MKKVRMQTPYKSRPDEKCNIDPKQIDEIRVVFDKDGGAKIQTKAVGGNIYAGYFKGTREDGYKAMAELMEDLMAPDAE